MRLSGNLLIRAPLVAIAAVAFCTGAMAQSAGYFVLGGEYDSDFAFEKTSSIGAPEASPSSITEMPDASATATEVAEEPQEAVARPMTDTEKRVRSVGPKFFAAP